MSACPWSRCLLRLCAVLLVGCHGRIDPAPGADDHTTGSRPGGSGPGSPSSPSCPAPNPGRSPIRRLNRSEWNNTIRDLIGDDRGLANKFALDESGGGFSNNADALLVTDLGAYQYQDAAESVAAAAITRMASWMPCDPARIGEPACARQLITTFGGRAFRRPLQPDEIDRFYALYLDGHSDGGFPDGVELVLQAFLQSPHFLYRVESGLTDRTRGNAVPLTSHEMAARLSYFLRGSMPDDLLFQAAAAGELGTVAGIEAQVRRLVGDMRAHQMVSSFHREWLGMDAIEGLSKASSFWTPTVRSALRAEVQTFVDEVFWNDGHMQTLLAAPYSFLDPELLKFYGLPARAATGFVRTDLDPRQRAGLVTQAGLLALHSYPDQSSPIHRGKFVREQLLCQPLAPPPNNIMVKAPTVDPAAPTRQRFAQHESKEPCASCHKQMDPIGFGFEHYDPTGRWRDKDGTFAVDAQGALTGTDVDGVFEGAVELAHKLQTSKVAKACIATQWFRYAVGRLEVDGDACTLAGLAKRMQDTGDDMRELLAAIAISDAFRYLASGGGGQ